jgi:hypothetical protein
MSEQAQSYIDKPVQMRTTAPNENLGYCVFAIERQVQEGKRAPHGTGFYIGVDFVWYAVTARHVVQQLDRSAKRWGDMLRPLFIRAIRDSADGSRSSFSKQVTSPFPSYEEMFAFHEDDSVDAVVFPMYRLANAPEKTRVLPVSLLQPDDAVKAGEDVHLFGFPGLYGHAEGTCVVRSGTICLKVNEHTYLLDANAWPGDSGGLVCSKPYFGVPEGQPSSWQWQGGGKIVGLQSAYHAPSTFGLPAELEPFRLVVSAQAVIEILESQRFKSLHARISAGAAN